MVEVLADPTPLTPPTQTAVYDLHPSQTNASRRASGSRVPTSDASGSPTARRSNESAAARGDNLRPGEEARWWDVRDVRGVRVLTGRPSRRVPYLDAGRRWQGLATWREPPSHPYGNTPVKARGNVITSHYATLRLPSSQRGGPTVVLESNLHNNEFERRTELVPIIISTQRIRNVKKTINYPNTIWRFRSSQKYHRGASQPSLLRHKPLGKINLNFKL